VVVLAVSHSYARCATATNFVSLLWTEGCDRGRHAVPAAARLEAQGALSSEWRTTQGPPRRYYVLSLEGIDLYQRLTASCVASTRRWTISWKVSTAMTADDLIHSYGLKLSALDRVNSAATWRKSCECS